MSNKIRIILFVLIFIYYIIVINLLKRGKIALKYTLLWLLMGLIVLILVIFPFILEWICNLTGIVDGMNGLLSFASGLLIILVMSLTAIVSKQSERIKNLTQNNALLEKRMRNIENQLEKKEK